ncbi:MAG TPA: hypothetical protein VNE58_14250 [Casimicrobiaceae bacterium]|nr:hypothetical protein [Casimicrobiaceae bacterium]
MAAALALGLAFPSWLACAQMEKKMKRVAVEGNDKNGNGQHAHDLADGLTGSAFSTRPAVS